MSEIKNAISTEMTLSDLRRLGGQGGVTARLLTGEIVTLKEKYATVSKKAIVADQLQTVDLIIPFPELYRQIRTVQRNHLLIARRVRFGKQSILQLTGKGYHRPQ